VHFDGNDSEIYTINASGGHRVQLITNNTYYDYNPSYSPDGKRIAYTHFNPFRTVQEIYTINAGGGGKVRGAHISGPCGGGPTSDCTFKETELSWGSRP
jgi:Tol biopolymer transport system component